MSAVIIVLLFLCAQGMSIAAPDKFQEKYIALPNTNCIKGFFVLIVFTSHFRDYVTLMPSDAIAVAIVKYLGQLMVAPFLFYSGYGVMESIKKKGLPYIKSIPVQRALKTLMHFDVAIIMYLIARYLCGTTFPVKRVLLAFTAWESIGNSNWYIFTVVSLYLISALSSFIFRRNHFLAAFSTTLFSVVLCHVLSLYKVNCWFNTILCYVLGVWYSVLHEQIEKVVMRRDVIYFAAMAFSFMAYHWLSGRIGKSTWVYQFYAVFFVILLVGITMKISFNSPLLSFLGNHIFSIYILQRLVLIVLSEVGIYSADNVSLYLLSFTLTCILALIFESVTKKLDSFIFDRKQALSTTP